MGRGIEEVGVDEVRKGGGGNGKRWEKEEVGRGGGGKGN